MLYICNLRSLQMATILDPSGVMAMSYSRSRLHWCIIVPARFHTMISLSTLAEMKVCPSGNHRQTVTISLCSIVRTQLPDYSINLENAGTYICEPHFHLVIMTCSEEPLIVRGPIYQRNTTGVISKHMQLFPRLKRQPN